MRTRAVLYASKSTEDVHASIPDQLQDAAAKAQEDDWEVIGEFVDESFSGYSGNRGPGLQAALQLASNDAAETGQTCMVVCQHSDRFARGAGDRPGAADSLIEVWHRMRRCDVHLRSFQNDVMLSRPVLVAVASEQAHEESKRKSDAVRDGMRRRAEKGLPTTGRHSLGLRSTKDGYVPVPDQIPIVERIFREAQAGRPQRHIAQDLQRDGVPTLNGGRWHQGTVAAILRSPVYKGCIVHLGETLPGNHEPIVDPELWEEVNAMLTSRAKSRAGKGRGRPPKGKHLFRKGMLQCICGETMVPRTTANRQADDYEVYFCYGRRFDVHDCDVGPLRRADIDTAIYNYFEGVALDVEATRSQLASAHEDKLAEASALLSQAQTEQRRTEERIERVKGDYLDDAISASDWTDLRSELEPQLEAAKAKVAQLSSQVAEVEAWGFVSDAEEEVIEKLALIRQAIAGEITDAPSTDAVRAALLRLFDGFALRKVQPGAIVPAELAWQGEYVIEPLFAEGTVLGETPWRPILRRDPIYDSATERINSSASPS